VPHAVSFKQQFCVFTTSFEPKLVSVTHPNGLLMADSVFFGKGFSSSRAAFASCRHPIVVMAKLM
jgi:hypothetical protein